MRWAGQRGQTAAEYMGVLFIAASIVAAIASSGLGGRIDRAVVAQICRLQNGDHCGTGGRSTRAARPARARAASAGGVTARAANIPCDGLPPRTCTAIRGMINRAQAAHQAARENYIRYAADFALWVAGVEGIRDVRDVIWRPGIVKAVNALIRKEVNREGARLLTSISNDSLFDFVRANYRYGAKIGKGSTADALEHEVATGVRYGTPGSHYIKARQGVRALNKILRRERLTRRERQIATNIRQELSDALPPQYRPKLR